MNSSQIHTPLLKIVSDYTGVLLDAYGVFWGGNAIGMLPGAENAMKHLVESGKIVGILSNATRITDSEKEKLKKHGIFEGVHYHFLITSGQIAREHALSGTMPFSTANNKYFVLGGPYTEIPIHKEIFADSVFEETDNINEASFIYVSTPHLNGKDHTDASVFDEIVRSYVPSKLPMLCANPDSHAHEGNPPQAVVRQGSLARKYQELNGEAHYIGKPYAPAFERAMREFMKFGVISPDKVVMIGDTPETDVKGSKSFGMGSVLITRTGIASDRLKHNPNMIENLKDEEKPTFYLERFSI
ncbi:MAG: TIGR01459 family HAD-type hydrolase [Chlamydiae bacterium]|nr:TIGR01459 family HAD-type hydrolase [Chlamydiota bacterium]